HDRGFLGRELAWLEEDVVRDADFAEIVQRRGAADRLDRRFVEAERPRESRGVDADALRVPTRAVVAVLGRPGQAVEDLDPGLVELGRALPDRVLESLVLLEEPTVHEARLEEVADPEQDLRRVERLRKEI